MSGDTLFLEGCGRTDLPGGDPAALYDSLTHKLAKVPDSAVLFPGHLYSAEPSQSMADTRRWNYVFTPEDARSSGSPCSGDSVSKRSFSTELNGRPSAGSPRLRGRRSRPFAGEGATAASRSPDTPPRPAQENLRDTAARADCQASLLGSMSAKWSPGTWVNVTWSPAAVATSR